MDSTVQAATNAVQEFLKHIPQLDDDIVDQCDDLLISIWYIENPHIRIQIIQTAALNIGLLREEDLD